MTGSAPVISQVFLVVAGALIRNDGRILVQQRRAGKQHAGLWEFPGGKVEPGETPEEALARELTEELGIMVDPALADPLTFTTLPGCDRHLILLLYRLTRWTGEPRALDAAALRWATIDELRLLPMPPADVPFIDVLARSR